MEFYSLVSNSTGDSRVYARPDRLFSVSAASMSSIDMPESTLVPRLVRSLSPLIMSMSKEPRSEVLGAPLGISGKAGGGPYCCWGYCTSMVSREGEEQYSYSTLLVIAAS